MNLAIIARLIRLGAAAVEGSASAVQIAKEMLSIGMDLGISADELKHYLDEEARKRVEIAVDAVEALKFEKR